MKILMVLAQQPRVQQQPHAIIGNVNAYPTCVNLKFKSLDDRMMLNKEQRDFLVVLEKSCAARREKSSDCGRTSGNRTFRLPQKRMGLNPMAQ